MKLYLPCYLDTVICRALDTFVLIIYVLVISINSGVFSVWDYPVLLILLNFKYGHVLCKRL